MRELDVAFFLSPLFSPSTHLISWMGRSSSRHITLSFLTLSSKISLWTRSKKPNGWHAMGHFSSLMCPHDTTKCYHHSGLLARMKWYRAVLDEAQFIRNR